jgi:PPOX class probable F420-dependent enzyme
MEPRMSVIPVQYHDLLDRPIVAALGTSMADGSPHVTPVWFSFADELFYVNAAIGRIKDKNIKARPYVSLLIVDPNNAYRYLAVRGPVIDISDAQVGREHINFLSNRYFGRPIYRSDDPNEIRARYTVQPAHVSAMG